MSDARNVWVFIEVVRGKIKGVSLELLGQGRKMADDLGEKLVAIIPGNDYQFGGEHTPDHEVTVYEEHK